MSAERVILLDVEGTVAPLTLTTEVLFPYARTHFANFLDEKLGDPAVRADLSDLLAENRNETDASFPRIPYSQVPELSLSVPDFELFVMVYITWLMDRDRKSTALKSLQGKIWKAGFESGRLKGTLFEDVPEAFARWSKTSRVAIYSSGSTEAQQLLFRHSNYGDLTPLIAGYFDTRTGAKQESASYAAIAAKLEVAPVQVLFFSDVVRELDAAREAGCQTRLAVRPGNAPVEDAHGHPAVESFARI